LHGPALARNVLANWRLGTGGSEPTVGNLNVLFSSQQTFSRIDLAQRVSLAAASNIGVFMDVAVGSFATDVFRARADQCPLCPQ
jgi:hypothetical protein